MLMSAGVVESGPVTRVTRHRASWQSSEITLDIAEFAGLDFVELRFVIDWHEHEQMLMLEVPTAMSQAKIYAKVPGEILERGVNGEEEPYQDWAAVQGKISGNDYTVAVLNNSTYSYDCLGSLFRTVLIRSAPFARHNPNLVPHDDINAWQDQGRQERKLWLMGGRGNYTELALDRRAEELQTPAEYVVDSAHAGTKPWEESFLEIMPANVWVLAVKQAEQTSGATVVRVQERSGKQTRATIKSRALGLDQTVDLAPWETKTLLVEPHGKMREVSLLEV
jgi:alpha-mannosidase